MVKSDSIEGTTSAAEPMEKMQRPNAHGAGRGHGTVSSKQILRWVRPSSVARVLLIHARIGVSYFQPRALLSMVSNSPPTNKRWYDGLKSNFET